MKTSIASKLILSLFCAATYLPLSQSSVHAENWLTGLTGNDAARIIAGYGLVPMSPQACDLTSMGVVMDENGLRYLICFMPNNSYPAGKYRVNELHQLIALGVTSNNTSTSDTFISDTSTSDTFISDTSTSDTSTSDNGSSSSTSLVPSLITGGFGLLSSIIEAASRSNNQPQPQPQPQQVVSQPQPQPQQVVSQPQPQQTYYPPQPQQPQYQQTHYPPQPQQPQYQQTYYPPQPQQPQYQQPQYPQQVAYVQQIPDPSVVSGSKRVCVGGLN